VTKSSHETSHAFHTSHTWQISHTSESQQSFLC
jgi:hypothetical protein